ncbi:MAG: PilN domain-containing protein [Deltaproteobacteria bacterium]|nr:PilN domain-containing protein [Deltaproteobacteria bacterium]
MRRIELNLATFEYQDKQIAYPMLAAAALLLLLLSLYGLKLFSDYRQQVQEFRASFARLEKKQSTRKKIQRVGRGAAPKQETESSKAAVELVNRLITMDVFPWGRLLDELEDLTPPGITVQSFSSGTDEKKIRIEGKASSMNEITQFLKGLDGSKLYRDTVLSNVSVGKVEGEKDKRGIELPIHFEITISSAREELLSPEGRVLPGVGS